MGLLEDAIREHLDLKRSHGADPSEIAQEERDALGPIQQRAAQPAQPAPDEVLDEPSEDPIAEYAGDEASEPFAPLDSESAPVAVEEPPPLEDHGGASEPPPPAPSTELFDVEDEPFAPAPPPAEEPVKEEEDVLEETPEFLQETPEHDRLWFEQKPPRDFDFDH